MTTIPLLLPAPLLKCSYLICSVSHFLANPEVTESLLATQAVRAWTLYLERLERETQPLSNWVTLDRQFNLALSTSLSWKMCLMDHIW